MATTPGNGSGDRVELTRVSMSVEVLRQEVRAANAETRDELKTYIDTKLQPILDKQAAVDRGDFTMAATRAIKALIAKSFSQRAAAGFSARERKIALLGLCAAMISMGAAVYVSIHAALGG